MCLDYERASNNNGGRKVAMTATQPELPLSTKAGRGKAGPRHAATMLRLLLGHKCWLTRADFKERAGLNFRACALGREAAHGRIIRGPRGYKATACATPEEIQQSSAMWLAQIKSEAKQRKQMLHRAHKILNGEEQ